MEYSASNAVVLMDAMRVRVVIYAAVHRIVIRQYRHRPHRCTLTTIVDSSMESAAVAIAVVVVVTAMQCLSRMPVAVDDWVAEC